MSPPRCPVPRPSSKSLERNRTCARMRSGLIPLSAACAYGSTIILPADTCAWAFIPRVTAARANQSTIALPRFNLRINRSPEGSRCMTPRKTCGLILQILFLRAFFQQAFKLSHKFFDVLEVHIHRRKANISNLIELFQAMHQHLANSGRIDFALRSFLNDALNLIDDGLQFRRRYGPLLAGFEQALKNFLPVKALASPVFLDDHVGDFVDALVGGKSAATAQALAPSAN